MTKPAASPSKSAMRFCGSCVLWMVCWTLWIGLTVSLVMLLYVATAKELPVPNFVLRRVETELAKADLKISFGRARLDPKGQILLNDVTLSSPRYAEPLISSRIVYLRRSFWSIIAGDPIPDEIKLEGATVQLPAMLSPSGTAERLLSDVVVAIRHDDRLWQLDQFTAHLGPLAITATGETLLSPRPRGQAPITISELTTLFLRTSRRLATELPRLDALSEPSLALKFEHRAETGSSTVTALFTAKSIENPLNQPLAAGPLFVTATLPLHRSNEEVTVQFFTAVRRGEYQNQYSADTVRAIVSAQFLPSQFSFKWTDALIAAGTGSAHGQKIHGPVVRVAFGEWPALRTEVLAQVRGEFLAAEIDAQLKAQTARVHAEGRASHQVINEVLSEITPRAAPYFVFGDPVTFRADLTLGPGWKFVSLRSHAEGGRLDSRGVGITELRGRVDIDGNSFLAHDAMLALNENHARGSYWMDFETTDYRMLLNGQLRPTVINGWFRGDWWLIFWNSNFDFNAALPNADVDVQGRWRDAAQTSYFGRAGAATATVFGAEFNAVHSLIFLRPNFTHALEVRGSRAAGQQELAGWFKRFTNPVTNETNRITFSVDSTVDADTYLKMTRGKAAAVLDGLQFKRPARVHAEGSIDGEWPGAVANLRFNGRAAGGLHFYDYPLDTVQVSGAIAQGDLKLDDIQFTAAGGKGNGTASLSGATAATRVLAFDVKLKSADLPSAIRSTMEFQALRNNSKTPAGAEDIIKRAAGGKLDLSLSARGQPGELASFTGNGEANLTGANLGEIQLFGLLSQALSKLSLNFSSLKLDTAHSTLRLNRGELHFPDLRISGSGAVIEAHGDYIFDSSSLDFTAKLKPFEENRNILTAAIGLVITPITSILELKLSGPLNKPNWSVNVGGSAKPTETTAPPTTSDTLPKPETPDKPAN
ncbi:hypothetical protein [Oleiharenicola lentus]|uniref:hypothetical protein n=1 Tax=Oleiharenicola lentus TaxID=2508720 RepID=UPI003F66A562